MFGNKNDPLVDAVTKVMEENNRRREIEKNFNESLGIYSRNALPHENRAEYDRVLTTMISEAASPEKYSPKQKKLAALGGNPKEIDAPDLAAARAGHAKHIEEADKSDPPFDPDPKKSTSWTNPNRKASKLALKAMRAMEAQKKKAVEPPFDPDPKKSTSWTSPKSKVKKLAMRALEAQKKLEEEQLDEKAVSKAQHRFFGLVRAIQKGEAEGSPKAEKAASEMLPKEVRKFAETKEKGLPEKMDEENKNMHPMTYVKLHKDDGKVSHAEFHHTHIKLGEKPKTPEGLRALVLASDTHKDLVKKGYTMEANGHKERDKYYSYPVKITKGMNENYESLLASVQEEIRNSLLEKAHWLNENGTQQQIVEFLNDLTMEEREILNLDEQATVRDRRVTIRSDGTRTKTAAETMGDNIYSSGRYNVRTGRTEFPGLTPGVSSTIPSAPAAIPAAPVKRSGATPAAQPSVTPSSPARDGTRNKLSGLAGYRRSVQIDRGESSLGRPVRPSTAPPVATGRSSENSIPGSSPRVPAWTPAAQRPAPELSGVAPETFDMYRRSLSVPSIPSGETPAAQRPAPTSGSAATQQVRTQQRLPTAPTQPTQPTQEKPYKKLGGVFGGMTPSQEKVWMDRQSTDVGVHGESVVPSKSTFEKFLREEFNDKKS
jgi:hypothetical protein